MKKKTRAAALILGLLLLAAACAPGSQPQYEVTYPKAVKYEDYAAARQVLEDNPITDDFSAALADFSYASAAAVFSGEGGNANFSPLSLYLALSCAAVGARGDTQAQLLALLGVDSADTLASQCGNLFRRLYLDNGVAQLKIANSLWMAQGIGYQEAFLRTGADSFYAQSFTVDFADPAAGKAMGRWIAENTGGTLEPTLETNPETVMAIINTIYFYDQWVDSFNKKNTAPDTFRSSEGDVTADFMNTGHFGGFSVGQGFTRASLPLKSAGSMVFILPDEDVNLDDLLASADGLRQLFEDGEDRFGKVTWKIPKFSFDSEYGLVPMLKALGVADAFDESSADFSGITTDLPVYISDAIQQTHIAINEEGVEASAFTALMLVGTAMPVSEYSAEMLLDRPFVYGITSADGTLLFVGICRNPA